MKTAVCLVIAIILAASVAPAQEVSATLEVQAKTITGTVQSVDAGNRLIAIRTADDTTREYRFPEQLDLTGVSDGDAVRITLMDSYAVFVGRRAAVEEQSSLTVTLTPEPSSERDTPPQAVTVSTRLINARIVATDPRLHTITIRLSSGHSRTIPVGPAVDLDALEWGDDVTIQITEATAYAVEKM